MRYGETLLVIAYTDVNLMAAKEPLLQEDGDVSFESVSSVSSEEESHEAAQVLTGFVTSVCTRFVIASPV